MNLGNWLVLEKWMGDSPLSLASSEDERGLVREYRPEVLAHMLDEHRRTYITRHDFEWLRSVGVNLVRIPVPYHLFGTAHHAPSVEYLDAAFSWAERNDIQVLVDLHTVPLSQNSFDNGGYLGLCAWARDVRRVDFVLGVLERIGRRYAGHPALWGIEVLNEPASRAVLWHNLAGTFWRYPGRALRSRPISHRALRCFYERAYACLRAHVDPSVTLVFHDQFRLERWEGELCAPAFENVALDTHCYLNFSEFGFERYDASEYLDRLARFEEAVVRASHYHPVIVGEWSLANHSPLVCAMGETERRAFYRTLADAQLAAWDKALGGVYWSYKVADPRRRAWSLRHAVEAGWLDLGR